MTSVRLMLVATASVIVMLWRRVFRGSMLGDFGQQAPTLGTGGNIGILYINQDNQIIYRNVPERYLIILSDGETCPLNN